MTRWHKRILIFVIALTLLSNVTLFIVANASSLPPALRRPVWNFAYNHLSLAPRSGEPYAVYPNKDFGSEEELAVAFYDGHENNVLVTHPGGDDHRHAAMLKNYHLRVSAPNDQEAARLLREYLMARGFKGTIRVAITFAHGSQARPMLGRTRLGNDIFRLLSEYRPYDDYADVVFVSCDIARGEVGKKFIQRIADEYGVRVSASDRSVGWDFAAKWFKADEGKRNFEIEKQDWWTATPQGDAPRKYSEVFSE
ncbi:MAG TPA: DUF4347 domain-containing protein [Pyrinomonadaceae bacterium]|nr:DUF4347 domain-containing protein [Pyrinomonadaceae bacterium]